MDSFGIRWQIILKTKINFGAKVFVLSERNPQVPAYTHNWLCCTSCTV